MHRVDDGAVSRTHFAWHTNGSDCPIFPWSPVRWGLSARYFCLSSALLDLRFLLIGVAPFRLTALVHFITSQWSVSTSRFPITWMSMHGWDGRFPCQIACVYCVCDVFWHLDGDGKNHASVGLVRYALSAPCDRLQPSLVPLMTLELWVGRGRG